MRQDYVELARRGYALLNEAYKSGEFEQLLPYAEQWWDPEIVVTASDRFPEVGEWRGYEGMLEYIEQQTEAFSQLHVPPLEFLQEGESVIVVLRLQGEARHTGIEIDLHAAHLWTMRDGRALRLNLYESKSAALEAAGLAE
jgi:ketosteroid isomerase-like protein